MNIIIICVSFRHKLFSWSNLTQETCKYTRGDASLLISAQNSLGWELSYDYRVWNHCWHPNPWYLFLLQLWEYSKVNLYQAYFKGSLLNSSRSKLVEQVACLVSYWQWQVIRECYSISLSYWQGEGEGGRYKVVSLCEGLWSCVEQKRCECWGFYFYWAVPCWLN